MITTITTMIVVWGLAPGDDPEALACLHLELVILGCGGKKTRYYKKKTWLYSSSTGLCIFRWQQ